MIHTIKLVSIEDIHGGVCLCSCTGISSKQSAFYVFNSKDNIGVRFSSSECKSECIAKKYTGYECVEGFGLKFKPERPEDSSLTDSAMNEDMNEGSSIADMD